MYDKMEFLKGLALGLAGKPLEFSEGEPVEETAESGEEEKE